MSKSSRFGDMSLIVGESKPAGIRSCTILYKDTILMRAWLTEDQIRDIGLVIASQVDPKYIRSRFKLV